MTRARILRWLRVAFGLGLLALLIARVDPSELAVLARNGDPKKLALALACLFLANPGLQSLRLHVLCARYTGNLATSFRVFTVGSFFNTMLPSNVGGDAVKLLYLKRMRAHESWAAPFALLMLHRASGMLVLLFGAAIRIALDRDRLARLVRAAGVEARLPWRALALACVAFALLALAFVSLPAQRSRLGRVVSTFARDSARALREVGVAAACSLVALTLAFHALRVFAFALLVDYTGQRIAPLDILIVLAATAVAGVVPISVGGLGLMEGTISAMLSLFGVPESAGLVAGVANRVILWLGAAIGGLLYVAARPAGEGPFPPP